MYNLLVHLHSVNRWIILGLLMLALFKAFTGWFGKQEFTESDRKTVLFGLISIHIQFLLGLWLYFISPLVSFEEGSIKNEIYRFYTVEHFTIMIVAVILITVGFSLSKRAKESLAKFKRIAIFYTIGLLIILASIPWPFRIPGAGWY